MFEIRIDPLSGLRAIVGAAATEPYEARSQGATADGPGWSVGVGPLLDPDRPDPPPQDDPDIFQALAARGRHEVIVDSQRPKRTLAELPVERVQAAADVWRERMRAHDGAAYVHLSVDEGPAAAAVHAHTQLYALDFVPAAVARERERFGAYATRMMGANLLEDLVQQEVRRRERIVAIDAEAVLWCPYASRTPFQLMLAPRRGRARFQDDGATGAALLHRGLSLLRARFGGESPPLTLWVRTAPRGVERFCWRIDVVPRLMAPGGLELGTGVAVNPVAPERAAAQLRELL